MKVNHYPHFSVHRYMPFEWPINIVSLKPLKSITCVICENVYDLKNHRPLQLPCCGHGICMECKKRMSSQHPKDEFSDDRIKFKCPFCRRDVEKTNRHSKLHHFLKSQLEMEKRLSEKYGEDDLICCGCNDVTRIRSHRYSCLTCSNNVPILLTSDNNEDILSVLKKIFCQICCISHKKWHSINREGKSIDIRPLSYLLCYSESEAYYNTDTILSRFLKHGYIPHMFTLIYSNWIDVMKRQNQNSLSIRQINEITKFICKINQYYATKSDEILEECSNDWIHFLLRMTESIFIWSSLSEEMDDDTNTFEWSYSVTHLLNSCTKLSQRLLSMEMNGEIWKNMKALVLDILPERLRKLEVGNDKRITGMKGLTEIASNISDASYAFVCGSLIGIEILYLRRAICEQSNNIDSVKLELLNCQLLKCIDVKKKCQTIHTLVRASQTNIEEFITNAKMEELSISKLKVPMHGFPSRPSSVQY